MQRSTRSKVDMDFVLGIGGYDLDRIVENIEPKLLEEEVIHSFLFFVCTNEYKICVFGLH